MMILCPKHYIRHLWFRRNIFVFENKFESQGRVFHKAQKLMEDYQQAQKPDIELTSN